MPWGASALRVRVIGAKVVGLGLKLGLGTMLREGVFRYTLEFGFR